MVESLKKTLLASLGVASFTREKLSGCIDELVERGELTRKQGLGVVQMLLSRSEEDKQGLVDRIVKDFERLLDKAPVSREELRELRERVEALESRAAINTPPAEAATGAPLS